MLFWMHEHINFFNRESGLSVIGLRLTPSIVPLRAL
jgi:hypothetical protein